MSSTDDTPGSRRHPRFDGRRVRVSDLLEAGLLQPGQKLHYQRRRGEAPHESVVTKHGRLRLTDGREFDTPSAAGAAASRATAVAGWSAWQIGPHGPSLHQLRQQLLQTTAAEEAKPADGLSEEALHASRRLVDFLMAAHDQARAGDPKELTVRELLRVWGSEDRDRDTVHRIGVDLDNAGLTTAPDFRAVSLDRTIRLILPSGDDTSRAESIGDPSSTKQAEVDDEVKDDIGLTLGYLVGKKKPLIWVPPSATLAKVITEMEINDFSQLPVLADPYTLHGAVSWESIARWRRRPKAGAPMLSDVIYTRARVFDYDVRLLDVLDVLQEEEFIFVRDFDRKITGIITAADVVETYDETATPFFLIGEVDQELRQLLRNAFDLDTIRRVCRSGNGISSFDSLTMYHYETVLNDPDCWAKLAWGLDREVVITRLSEIRHVRNRVMHFNADLVDPDDVKKLRNFLVLIRRYAR